MFNQILHKSIQVGEKLFHVLCDVSINSEDLKNCGAEIIKIAAIIEAQNNANQQAQAPQDENKEQSSEQPQPEPEPVNE
jgi:hypothetical protein